MISRITSFAAFIIRTAIVGSIVLVPALSGATAASSSVQLQWLEQPPSGISQSVSWGVPWPQGSLTRDQTFSLVDTQGRPLPLQTWPLAFWPDGSLKWSGLATVVPADSKGPFSLSKAESRPPAAALT